jgi:hypothetical protein
MPKRPVPKGKAILRTDAGLERAALVRPEDVSEAVRDWKSKVSGPLRELLDAEPEPE